MDVEKKILEVLVQFITTDIEPESINSESSLKNDLGIDSISIIQILIILEEEFNIIFEEEEINGLREFGSLAECIKNKLE